MFFAEIFSSFAALFVLAFVMSMEFGQTAVEIVRRGMHEGFRNAVLVSLGATVAEICFLTLTLFGFIVFLSNPQTLTAVWFMGGCATSYMGIKGFLSHKAITISVDGKSNKPPFVTGFALNFLHPLNIVWWAGTLGPIVLSALHTHGYARAIVGGLGVPCGALVWWITLAFISARLRRALPRTAVRGITIISSIGLIGFGVYFFSKAFMA